MKFQIVADSSSDLLSGSIDDSEIGFSVVPLSLRIGQYEFIDDETMNPIEMLSELAKTKGSVGSACPSPEAWAEVFRRAQNTFAVCITSKLSGTYNAALQAKAMVLEQFPEKKIHVIDTKGAAGILILVVEKLFELIRQDLEYSEVKAEIDRYVQQRTLLFSLKNYDMLIKSGRMNKLVGLTATTLGIRAIATGDGGVVNVVEKVRGERKALERIVELMNIVRPNFRFEKNVKIMINHCNNLEAAQNLRRLIMEKYTGISNIKLYDTRGLCSFYAADGGLLISY